MFIGNPAAHLDPENGGTEIRAGPGPGGYLMDSGTVFLWQLPNFSKILDWSDFLSCIPVLPEILLGQIISVEDPNP
jgi:hypothetical protein